MISILFLYLYVFLLNVSTMIIMASIVAAIFWVLLALFTSLCIAGTVEKEREALRSINAFVWAKKKWLILCAVLICLTPSRSDLYFIAGGAVAISISQSEEAKKLPDAALKALLNFLETLSTEEGDES